MHAATEDRFGPVPEPVESLFAIQEAKLAVAAAGADYLVFRAGKATVGPVTLGGDELRALRDRHGRLHVRASRGCRANRRPRGALALAAAIVDLRRAA